MVPVPNMPPMNGAYGKTELFATFSTEFLGAGLINQGQMIQQLKYPSCIPCCGVDPGNNKWQNPQEVNLPAGQGLFDALIPGKSCSPFGGGAQGPPAKVPGNPNDTNDMPPQITVTGDDSGDEIPGD